MDDKRPAGSRWWRAAVGVVGAMCIAGFTAACSSTPAGVKTGSGGGPTPTGVGTCRLPRLPAVPGPAARLTGGPVTSALTLDGGALVVDPPPSGDKPAISATEAACTDLASGPRFGNSLASLNSGLSLGYGVVSVRQDLITTAASHMNDVQQIGAVSPKVPAPTAFHDRLAWVVVNTENYVMSCPAMPATSSAPTTTAPRNASYDYGILLLDATTGADSLIYYESAPVGCGSGAMRPPSVAVPVSQWSVPWALVSRDKHDYSASVLAQTLSCDGYQPAFNVDRGGNQAEVLVTRPLGATCQARQVPMTLRADTVFDTLPAGIVAGPVGLHILEIPPPGGAPSTQFEPLRSQPIINLGPQSSGTTVHLSVGQVLFVGDLVPGALTSTSGQPTSSNPDVLGQLGPSPSNEFRAWAPGQVTLTAPQQSCQYPTPPCSGPWVVHVDVS